MLKRAWLLISVLWAVLCLWGVAGRADGGIEAKYVCLALAPFILGYFAALAARFIVTGSPVRRAAVPYRRP